MQTIFVILWIFLPAGMANMAPVLAKNLKQLKKYNQPLDFGRSFRGRRIFGDHKTFRGLLAGIVLGMITSGLQMFLHAYIFKVESASAYIDYSSIGVILLGGIMGLGAVSGDAIKSFFKRQFNIPPGKSWVPFDQLDFVIGSYVASIIFLNLPVSFYIIGAVTGLILHPTINIIGWIFKLQDHPF